MTSEDDIAFTSFTSCDSDAYDKDTLVEGDSQNSVGSIYNLLTACNSIHDITSSPLPAHDHLLNLGLRGRGMHIGHLGSAVAQW